MNKEELVKLNSLISGTMKAFGTFVDDSVLSAYTSVLKHYEYKTVAKVISDIRSFSASMPAPSEMRHVIEHDAIKSITDDLLRSIMPRIEGISQTDVLNRVIETRKFAAGFQVRMKFDKPYDAKRIEDLIIETTIMPYPAFYTFLKRFYSEGNSFRRYPRSKDLIDWYESYLKADSESMKHGGVQGYLNHLVGKIELDRRAVS